MTEAVLALVVLAWLWREREHARERARLIERLTGVSLAPAPRRSVDRHWSDRKEAEAAKRRRNGKPVGYLAELGEGD